MYEYNWTSAGYVPEFCVRCRDAKSHELHRVDITRVGRLFSKRAKTVPYGMEKTCQDCGARSIAESDVVAVAQPDPVLDPETTLKSVFTEDCYPAKRLTIEQNLRAGLCDADTRLQMIYEAFDSCGVEEYLPRKPEEVVCFSKVRWAKIWLGCTAASMGLGFVIGPYVLGEPEIARYVGMGIAALFSSVLVAIYYSDREQNWRQYSLAKRIKPTLVRCLAPLSPTGNEIMNVHSVACREGWLSAVLDPHQILIETQDEIARLASLNSDTLPLVAPGSHAGDTNTGDNDKREAA